MSLKPLHEPETEDPILSVINLNDICMVIIAAPLIIVSQNSLLNPFNQKDVIVITDPGEPSMEVIIKKGEKIEKYKANGSGAGSTLTAIAGNAQVAPQVLERPGAILCHSSNLVACKHMADTDEHDNTPQKR